MRGHTEIIKMRKAGHKPPIVFLNDWPLNNKWREPADLPEVSIDGERPKHADLRFLIGLRVSITCTTKNRAEAFFEAAKAARAEIVACGWYESPKRNWFAFYDSRGGFEKITEDFWYAA